MKNLNYFWKNIDLKNITYDIHDSKDNSKFANWLNEQTNIFWVM